MQIVNRYGTMWARNVKNIKWIWAHTRGWQGVYILYDGSMPVYVGKGHIASNQRGGALQEARSTLGSF